MPGPQSEKAERDEWSMAIKTRDGSKGWGWVGGEEPLFSLQAPTTATPCLIPHCPVKITWHTPMMNNRMLRNPPALFCYRTVNICSTNQDCSPVHSHIPLSLFCLLVYSDANIFGSPSSLFEQWFLKLILVQHVKTCKTERVS